MNFIKIRSFVLGMVFMLVITITLAPVFASFNAKSITVQTGLKVYNDDQLLTLTDAAGNAVEPFMYNGTTYLPVRAVAGILGKAIAYDRKTQGVYIGTHDSDTPSIMLNELKAYKKTTGSASLKEYNSVKDNEGNIHSGCLVYHDAIGVGPRPVSYDYMIDGKYSKTKGVLFILDKASDTKGSAVLKIIGDGNILYTSPELKAGMKPISFSVDTTGIASISYQITELKSQYIEEFAIGDVGFYQ